MIGKLLSTVIEVAKLPFDAADDVFTMGGAITNNEPAIKRRVEKIQDKLESIDD